MAHNALRPFYFAVIFWGEVHRNYCTDLLMASLLSPGNIPALNPERKSKFLIVTTRSDWDALQSNGIFNQLKRYVEPVWFEMPFPGPDELKMLVMSQGHRLAVTKAFEDRAYGVFVTPDLVLSDGSVAAMERLAEAGKKVVLSVAIRFGQEILLEEMQREGYLTPGMPLVLPPRDLMRMALRNLHTETLRYEFDAPYFADQPISVYWRVPDGDGLIIHSFSWAPLVVDYEALHHHDTSTFDEWTMDGDYIYRNFPDPQDVYVVTDSDEIVLVSFTKEADLHFDLHYDLRRVYRKRFEAICKVGRIRSLWKSSIMDPLKRSIFPQPVYLHSNDISGAWETRRKETDQVVSKVLRSRTIEERFIADVYENVGQGRFSTWVLERFSGEDIHRVEVAWWGAIGLWAFILRPRRILLRALRERLSPLFWLWRYRRFVWWRLKEKLGWVEERHFDWHQGGWDAPGVSLVCPLFTLKWVWRYRRYAWWKLKERLGLVEKRHYDWQNTGWDAPGVSLMCPLYTARWLWRHRHWLLDECRKHGFTVRHFRHLIRSGPARKGRE